MFFAFENAFKIRLSNRVHLVGCFPIGNFYLGVLLLSWVRVGHLHGLALFSGLSVGTLLRAWEVAFS